MNTKFSLEISKEALSTLKENRSIYLLKSSRYNDAYIKEYEKLLNHYEIQLETSNDLEISAIQVKISEKIQEANQAFNEVKSFIIKAFPSSQGVSNEFGLGRFMAFNHNAANLSLFLKHFHQVLQQYSEDLYAVGLTVEKVDQIADLSNDLDVIQNAYKALMNCQPSKSDKLKNIERVLEEKTYDILKIASDNSLRSK